jgi:ABC-type glutathione transport system ATPase component
MPVGELRSPRRVAEAVAGLERLRSMHRNNLRRAEGVLEETRSFLKIGDAVGEALKTLSERLFERTIGLLEEKLTIALQEVLDQPIAFRAERNTKRGAASIEFFVEREGQREDILKGQGGSVANILSVGLRMFALASLDPKQHAPFLVLDEQDCWLHPDLVPRLVKIVHLAGRELGFQVLMISHHHHSVFERYADRILRLEPHPEGVRVIEMLREPGESDEGAA